MIKGSNWQENIACINIYAPNIEAPKYIKQILINLKRETAIVGDFNTPLTSIDRWSKQIINKETSPLNNTLDQMDLIDVYRAFHLKADGYTFISSVHGAFSRIDHMLDHKTSLDKFKKIEIISSIFSNHNGMKLEINYKKKIEKITNT